MSEDQLTLEKQQVHPRVAIMGLALPIISIVCCQIMVVITFVTMIVAFASLAQSTPGQNGSWPDAFVPLGITGIVMGLCTFSSPLVFLAGLALSMIGYRRPNADRTIPVLGIITNGALLVFSCFVVGFSVLTTLPDMIRTLSPMPPGY